MSTTPRALPRRTVLAASGTAVLATVAACASDPAPPAGTTATSAAGSATSAAAGSSAAATSAATTSASAPSATAVTLEVSTPAAATATGTPLSSVADVESAGSVVVDGADGPLLLASANGTVVAHTAICTHQGCTVGASGACPCHGSRYNITTGAVENGPALRALAEVTVTVADGQVYAG